MKYNRWAISERARIFFGDNAGKLVISVIIIIVLANYPDYARPIFSRIREWIIAFIALVDDKREFLFGVAVTVVVNYAKDHLRSSQEARAAGRALRYEASALGWKAKFHVDEIKKWNDAEGSYEDRIDSLASGLRSKSQYCVPGRLFHGTDYMPFFKPNVPKISTLRIKYLLQGDDIVRLSTRIHEFIQEYDAAYKTVVAEFDRTSAALENEYNQHKSRELARSYWLARDEYVRNVTRFRENCESLSSVLAKY